MLAHVSSSEFILQLFPFECFNFQEPHNIPTTSKAAAPPATNPPRKDPATVAPADSAAVIDSPVHEEPVIIWDKGWAHPCSQIMFMMSTYNVHSCKYWNMLSDMLCTYTSCSHLHLLCTPPPSISCCKEFAVHLEWCQLSTHSRACMSHLSLVEWLWLMWSLVQTPWGLPVVVRWDHSHDHLLSTTLWRRCHCELWCPKTE